MQKTAMKVPRAPDGGAPSPCLDNTGIGIGYIAGVNEGDEVLIVASPRKSVRAVVVRPPFY